VLLGLTAGWQAKEMMPNLEIFKIIYQKIYSMYYYTSGSLNSVKTHTSAWFLDREIHQIVNEYVSIHT